MSVYSWNLPSYERLDGIKPLFIVLIMVSDFIHNKSVVELTLNVSSWKRNDQQVFWADYASFFLILVIPLLISIYFGFRNRHHNTVLWYLLGNKEMTVFPVSISLIVSLVSVLNFVGLPTESYTNGSQFMMVAFAWIAIGIVGIFVFLPLIYKLQYVNVYEYFEVRFCKAVRTIATVFFVIRQLTTNPVQMYGAALAFNQIFGMNTNLVACTISLISTIYTTIGGFKAVVWADTIQGAIMFLTVITVLAIGFTEQEGITKVLGEADDGQRLEFFNMNPDPTIRLTFWTATIGLFFHFLGITIVYPSFTQRYISLSREIQAKTVIAIFTIGAVFFYTGNSVIGLIAYSKYKTCDPYKAQVIDKPDQIVPYFLLDVANNFQGITGFYLAGLISATMSSVSTGLNTSAGILFEDITSYFRNVSITEERSNLYIKCAVIILGLISTFVIFIIQGAGTIVEMCVLFDGLTGSITLGFFILGGLIPMTNSVGAVCAGIAGILMSIWLMAGYQIVLTQTPVKRRSIPFSTEGCPFNLTVRPERNFTVSSEGNTLVPYLLPLGKVSSFYYSLISLAATVAVGIIVSYITSRQRHEEVKPHLLCPIIRKHCDQRQTVYGEVALDEMT